MLFQEGYISIGSHLNTVWQFPRTNHNTSKNISPDKDTFSLLAFQALMTISFLYDQFFAPSRVAPDSSMNEILEQSTFIISFTHLKVAFFRVFLSVEQLSPVSLMSRPILDDNIK